MGIYSSQNILLIGFTVAFIILFGYYISKSEGFDADEYLREKGITAPEDLEITLVRPTDINMIGRSASELSYEDTIKNDGGGYVEYYVNSPSDNSSNDSNSYNVAICDTESSFYGTDSGELKFSITSLNNIFKYHHLNDKVFTITIPPGNYSGGELANALDSLLNKADGGWWVVWDDKKRRFSLGTFEFRYSRYMHPHSVYKTMGLESPEVFGMIAGTTDWLDKETGAMIISV